VTFFRTFPPATPQLTRAVNVCCPGRGAETGLEAGCIYREVTMFEFQEIFRLWLAQSMCRRNGLLQGLARTRERFAICGRR